MFSLALVDLDHFKRINDGHGHATGDEVLRGFARHAQASLRETDVIGRWGGEEFLVLFPETSAAEAMLGLERLHVALKQVVVSASVPHLRTEAPLAHTARMATTATQLLAGASGYSFKEWKGPFYPEKIKPEEMLAWYAARLPTVEINNTFYAMPKATVLAHWAEVTPEHFRFAIKAPKRITHEARLKADAAADSVAYLYKTLDALGAKRGAVLFQLPPFLKKDLPRLSEFLQLLPEGHRAAFEFRNDTWFDDAVYELLKGAGAALCLSEREDDTLPPLVATAPWGYVRLRLEHYSDGDLEQWADRIAGAQWDEACVYFMHEPTAPAYAQTLLRFATAITTPP